MKRLVLCLTLVLSCALPSARSFAADTKWIHATSAHFDMYSAQNEADARAALTHLEAVRAYFVTATHSKDPGDQPVRIVAFQSAGDFNKYKPAEYAASTAFPLAGPPATIVALGLKPENYEKIFFEYCQLVMDESAPRLPYWLRVGMAQFYSTLKPVETGMRLGAPPARAFHTHGQPDLIQLFTVDRAGYLAARAKSATDFYADTSTNAALGAKGAAATSALNAVQSNTSVEFEVPDWTLIHMLMFSPDYRPKVGEFIAVLGSGQETGAGLGAVYGRSASQVGKDLELYMKQSSFAVATVKFAYEKPAPPTAKAATKEEVDRIFADLSNKGK